MKDLSLYAVEIDTIEHGYIELLVDVTYFYHKEGEFSQHSASDLDYEGYTDIEWTPIEMGGYDDCGEPITININDLDLSYWEENEVEEKLIKLKLAEG